MGLVRVGIVGYGALGKFLAAKLAERPERFRLVWIYNRTPVAHPLYVSAPSGKECDLVVEVAHPEVLRTLKLLELGCDVFVGSPTCFADDTNLLIPSNVACYVPVGALWGAQDIQKMARSGTLGGLTIIMAKHPEHLKSVCGEARVKLDAYMADAAAEGPMELYRGPVGPLCPQAPNNVNTLACGALVGLGFQGTTGVLVADKGLTGHHVVTVQVRGKTGFECDTVRRNPAKLGAVTGSATFMSFWNSLLRAVDARAAKGDIHVV
jgi:predicted dinucleotide-utilizing enzyme